MKRVCWTINEKQAHSLIIKNIKRKINSKLLKLTEAQIIKF